MRTILRTTSSAITAVAIGACAFLSDLGVVRAQPNPTCDSLPDPIYVTAGSANAPLMKAIGKRLAALTSPTSLIFISTTTCVSLDAVVNGTAAMGNASYYLADGTQRTCTLPTVGGQAVDLALTGNTSASCSALPNPLPNTIGHFTGPISAVVMIVRQGSLETSISTEAVRELYTKGATTAGIAPWTVDSVLFRRNDTAYTQIYLAIAAGVSPTSWFGTDTGTTNVMISSVAAAGSDQARIGFTTAEVADQNEGILDVLAYQHTGQSCGYWPDSTSTRRDKANVRDGHYWLWGATNWYAKVDGTSGEITSDAARRLIGWVRRTVDTPEDVSFLDAEIEGGNVPECAMRVTRSGDLGALASFAPVEPCGCYFESIVDTTACTPCDDAMPCATSTDVCRFGFCEAY